MGRYPLVASMPEMGIMENKQMMEWVVKAGFSFDPDNDEIFQLDHFCKRASPVTKPMLPKLLTLLRCFHESDYKMNRWYFMLQETIRHHFKTEGTSMFLGQAKQIMSGEKKDFDWMAAFDNA